MKMWIDDVRQAPTGYEWFKTVDAAKKWIITFERRVALLKAKGYVGPIPVIELIDLDHDAGDFVGYGGDYIKLLDWLEETGRDYPIRIHSMNPVGVANMRAIIKRNDWKEVL